MPETCSLGHTEAGVEERKNCSGALLLRKPYIQKDRPVRTRRFYLVVHVVLRRKNTQVEALTQERDLGVEKLDKH